MRLRSATLSHRGYGTKAKISVESARAATIISHHEGSMAAPQPATLSTVASSTAVIESGAREWRDVNPRDAEVIARVPINAKNEVDWAVKAAAGPSKTRRYVPIGQRTHHAELGAHPPRHEEDRRGSIEQARPARRRGDIFRGLEVSSTPARSARSRWASSPRTSREASTPTSSANRSASAWASLHSISPR